MPSRRYLPWFAAALATLAASGASAQGAPAGPLAPRPGTTPEPPPASHATIRVEASEVVAPVIVTNRSGEMVLTLDQKEFHIFDDGVERPIKHFGLGGEPLSIALLVENSQRVAPLLPAIRKAGAVFAQPVMGETAEGEILAYDNSVEVLERFTTDADSLEAAIAGLRTGDRGVHLYDALDEAIGSLEQRPQGQRRILLVIGESADSGSRATLGQVLRHAQVANVTVYSVGLSSTKAALRTPLEDRSPATPPVPAGDSRQDEMNRRMESGADLMVLAVWLLETGKNAIGPNALAVASQSTGGRNIRTLRDRSIERAIDAIGGELHAQYTLGYAPLADAQPGYHQIRVTVDRPELEVRSRPGYYSADSP